MTSRISSELIQDNGIYKPNWYQYTLVVCGRSCPTGRFYLTHLALSSHENTAAWVRIMVWIKSIQGYIPRKNYIKYVYCMCVWVYVLCY